MKHKQLTAAIIACCMRVQSKLGRGYREIIYHRALKIELERAVLFSKVNMNSGFSIAASLLVPVAQIF